MYEPRNSKFFADLIEKEQKKSKLKEALSIKRSFSPSFHEPSEYPKYTPQVTQSVILHKYGKFLPSANQKTIKQFDFLSMQSQGINDFHDQLAIYKDKEAAALFKSNFSLDCWVKAQLY